MAFSDPAEQATTIHCRQCNASIPEGRRACICCGELVSREGLLSRIGKRLLEWCFRNRPIKIKGLSFEGQPVVKQHVYKSWDEVPPELAAKIEQARQAGGTVIQFSDNTTADPQTFRSWDEVPEELKKSIPAKMREQIAAELDRAIQQGDPVATEHDEIVVEHATTSRVLDFEIKGMRFGA